MNPYQVLGVSPSATKEEIHSAYLSLVKKYHPDRYQDSALKQQAEDKMKQINAAYDLLTKEPSSGSGSYGGGSYGGGSYGSGSDGSGSYGSGSYGESSYGGSSYGSGSYGGSSYGSGSYGSGSYSGQYSAEFSRVRSYINAGGIDEAEAVLAAIPLHNAEWYFLIGMCAYRRGQYSRAYENINRACSMAPDNVEYSRVLSSMRGGEARRSSGGLDKNAYCGFCSAMLCADLFCRVCCR